MNNNYNHGHTSQPYRKHTTFDITLRTCKFSSPTWTSFSLQMSRISNDLASRSSNARVLLRLYCRFIRMEFPLSSSFSIRVTLRFKSLSPILVPMMMS